MLKFDLAFLKDDHICSLIQALTTAKLSKLSNNIERPTVIDQMVAPAT